MERVPSLARQEMAAPATSFLSSHRDYIARARYLASGSSNTNASYEEELSNQSAADVKKVINRLTRAVSELRLGMLSEHLILMLLFLQLTCPNPQTMTTPIDECLLMC